MSRPHARWCWLGAVLLCLGVACGGSNGATHSPGEWVSMARSMPTPSSDDLQLSLDQRCQLTPRFEVAGTALSLVGSGSALYGDGQGQRYQCAWTGPKGDGLPANARLEVVALVDDGELERYRDLLAERADNTTVSSRGWVVDVAPDRTAATTGKIFAVDLLVPNGDGVVRLILEITDPALVQRFGPAEAADVLTRLVGTAPAGESASLRTSAAQAPPG